ncbi:MAG: glycogen debranching protein GlgX, partial [Gemmataceae bacterium]
MVSFHHGTIMFNLRIARGRSIPMGASAVPDGVNFALLSRDASTVQLIVFPVEGPEPIAQITLHPSRNRTGHVWHILVAGLPPAFCYGWRIDGPHDTGHAFDSSLVLLDPNATALSGAGVWGKTAEPRLGTSRHSLYIRRPYHWGEDVPLLTPMEETIIYEMHVRGFTCHPSSGSPHPGTFASIIEKIPYLQALGVTAVELLPIHEFDECDCPFHNPDTGEKHRNFWGYNSIAFAAPKASYAAASTEHGQIGEFRDMVKALHAAGIEVILDVVFNHTGEGDYRGRTSSFRGIDNKLYYMIGPDGKYLNFSGCGNTVNCNHPLIRDMIMNCLRYWIADMHVDGLRFDLASVLGRDSKGRVLADPPVVDQISQDGVLADTKLIAEPWDAAGLYQVGNFYSGRRWSEWNGKYRDDVRRFWRGDPGMAGALATRLCGSSDLYDASGRNPNHSINFITCHDGFTLWDLVSYTRKNNRANGENNRDGMDENFSMNCGQEGPSSDPNVLALRHRQVRNLFATLMLSQGVPMILAGDEFLRTQQGNNNAWCQDNDISWLNWDLAHRNGDFLRFAREMIALRKRHPALRRRTFLQPGHIVWHGLEPYKPDFSGRNLACVLDGRHTERELDQDFYMAFNAMGEQASFNIPPSPQGRPWRRVVDTALPSPQDIVPREQGPVISNWTRYTMAPFSLLV